MFMTENYLATLHSSSWVLDIGCSFHIYNNDQELKKGSKMLKGKMDVHVGNGAKVIALAIELII